MKNFIIYDNTHDIPNLKHQPLIPFNVIILKQQKKIEQKLASFLYNMHNIEIYTKKVLLLFFGHYANDEDPHIETHLYGTLIVHAQM